MYLKIKSLKFGIGLILIFLFLATIVASKNSPVIKYETRKINIALFQSGEISGGSLVQLPAVYHRQEHALSCEIASLKMALSVYGVNIPESELISKLKFDPTPRSKTTWGNPFSGFVGNIDGKMMGDGYGVYWDPIADVANQYLNSKVEQFDPQKLATEINNGHPVVAWGFSGGGKKVLWTAPEGVTITGINGEHARTIIGFTGSISDPTGFVIFDPIYGKLYWHTKDLMNNWAPFSDMGVVVLPKST